ncbi:MAG: glucosamine-6-phosphate synthase, partial [Acidimicrobiia bacterium]
MCGIIAVVRRRSTREVPQASELTALLDSALAALDADTPDLRAAAEAVEGADALLRGVPGVRALIADPQLEATVDARAAAIDEAISNFERSADAGELELSTQELEDFNSALIRVKDATWALRRDRLRTARAVGDLAGEGAGAAAIEAFTSVQVALSGIDRLEVRGRDSAGLHLLVTSHGLDLDAPDVAEELARRSADPLFTSLAVRTPGGALSFVYKAAAEIGELGDNTRVLRDAIRSDRLLHRALKADTAEVAVLGHTRWASVGVISEANAHPLNSEEIDGRAQPYCVAALNGDVDNYAELRDEAGLRIHADVTTDAKVIPTLLSRRLDGDQPLGDAFRETVRRFEGSVAIAAAAADEPGQLLLALRGSGQALYVGLAEDMFVVASEPYGVVEETTRYLRMDGEVPGPSGESGQVIVLDASDAGAISGIARLTYDGTEDPVVEDDLATAGITTRDIDRGDFPHFLLKEISESPQSMRKTLRGHLEQREGKLRVRLGDDSIPPDVRKKLASGGFRRVIAIGQGTAAIAA